MINWVHSGIIRWAQKRAGIDQFTSFKSEIAQQEKMKRDTRAAFKNQFCSLFRNFSGYHFGAKKIMKLRELIKVSK